MVQLEQRLPRLQQAGGAELLQGALIGLEKESLRVCTQGGIAQTPHPRALGSALTHPWITTDYSEALMEFITPPFACMADAMHYLTDIHSYVCGKLEDEVLWATSMPCVIPGEEGIPIAEYGSSNAGMMKTVYRRGLGYRYGRVMQVIAGVHFNYSVPESLWPALQRLEGEGGELRAFIDARYMGLIRNLLRYGWIIPYLFGASPAVCKSFLCGQPNELASFDESTYYEPYATSLRMGDIGYQNRREEGVGVKACYDDIGSYVKTLTHAIDTPAMLWEEIGVEVDGFWRQLNANILQIENEYYSSVRPKQVLEGLEKPSLALKRRGIRYVELRSLDVNAYHPLGIDETQLRFLQSFMLFCLLSDSPRIGLQERWEMDRNLERVAHRGREPGLQLFRSGQAVEFRAWAEELLAAMQPIAELLDSGGTGLFQRALVLQQEKVEEPELTPSARMLAEMYDRGESFYQFARRMSQAHHRYFAQHPLSDERRAAFDREAEESLRQQREMEAADEMDFASFLQRYFEQ